MNRRSHLRTSLWSFADCFCSRRSLATVSYCEFSLDLLWGPAQGFCIAALTRLRTCFAPPCKRCHVSTLAVELAREIIQTHESTPDGNDNALGFVDPPGWKSRL